MVSTNSVLPPYQSNFDPISSKPTGLYNPSSFGAAYTDPPGSVIPPPGTNIYCGGRKGKRRSTRRKLKSRRKSRSKKTRSHSKKKRGTKRKH